MIINIYILYNRFTMYKGGINQYLYYLHRITGVGVVLFLLMHIIDTSTVLLGEEVYNKVVSIFHNPIFKLFEVLLGTAVVFHALNGLRIIVFDFSNIPSKYAEPLGMLVVLLSVFSFFLFTYFIIIR
ncbi:MAG: succinate dehydrogenase, cytochrome b556 subunit [bacterium]|nr:succinate dehydrogenase, cytochrome b556 subunit [bacterium]